MQFIPFPNYQIFFPSLYIWASLQNAFRYIKSTAASILEGQNNTLFVSLCLSNALRFHGLNKQE